jgi:4-hydroxybenzoate polyprenyltransferase
MLTTLTFIIFSIILVPVIFILLIVAFAYSLLYRAKIKRTRYSEQKPKGTIEILPAEKDEVNEGKKVGKDKFREL